MHVENKLLGNVISPVGGHGTADDGLEAFGEMLCVCESLRGLAEAAERPRAFGRAPLTVRDAPLVRLDDLALDRLVPRQPRRKPARRPGPGRRSRHACRDVEGG